MKYAIIDLTSNDETISLTGVSFKGRLLSPVEAEALFKSVWNAADERCCDEWENKEYGAGGDSNKVDWEQFKLTL